MILFVIFLIFSLVCDVVIYACCVVSGRISRREEERMASYAKSN